MSANEMDAVVARLTATLDAHDAVARGEGAPDGTTFPILASKADIRALLAQLEAAKRDAARWCFIRSFLGTDGDLVHEDHGPPYEFVTVREDRLHQATCREPSMGATVEFLVDAALDAARTPTGAPENG